MKTFTLFLRQPGVLPCVLIVLVSSTLITLGLSHPFARSVAVAVIVGATMILGMTAQAVSLALASARGDIVILKRKCTREDHNH